MQYRTAVLALVLLALFSLSTSPVLESVVPAIAAQAPADVVVHVADLPSSALSEWDFWPGPASPGGKMIGTPQKGDQLDPPPENDPHVMIKLRAQPATEYRCWVHMYVGKPMGVSKANKVWVQFSDAVDKSGKEVLKPGSGEYLTVQGPEKEGWVWVGDERLVSFRTGDVTMRIQAGMEGVGFDQIVLSPSKYLRNAPTGAIVPKSK